MGKEISQELFSEEALNISKKDGWTFSTTHFSPLSLQAAPDILWNLILPEHNCQEKSPTQDLGKALGIIVQVSNV